MNIHDEVMRILAAVALLTVAPITLADTYTSIDFPGAVATDLSGINDRGVIVGTYTDATGATHGFKVEGDTLAAFDYPGAISTAATSVNSLGDISGFFLDAAMQWHGFVLSHDEFFVQDYPGATTGTFTLGIGANGTLVGEFKVGQIFGQLGFAWILRDGLYTQLTPPDCSGVPQPNPVQAFALAVNPREDVVGRLIDAAGRQCGWRLDKYGEYTILQVAGASITNAKGINASGEVVGVYRLGVNHGFMLDPKDTTSFITIDFPGASATRINGNNARGDIVGSYAFSGPQGTGHGFLLQRDGR